MLIVRFNSFPKKAPMENVNLILTGIIFASLLIYIKRRIVYAQKKLSEAQLIYKDETNLEKRDVEGNLPEFEQKHALKIPTSIEMYETVPQMGYSAPNYPTDIPYTVVENDVVVNPTILVVDGNRNSWNQLAGLFHNRNTVLTAENGLAALDILKATPSVSLIISDVELPMMDGFQLLTALKAKEDYCHIPFIMLTAQVDLHQKLKALRIGVDDYLIKPFEKEELLVRVDNLLKNHAERLKFFWETSQQPAPQNEHNTPILLTPDELEWMEHLELYIQQHISDVHLTAEDIAEGLCVSRAQLFRRVK